MTFDAVVERFKARRTGAGYMATCPAHDDGTASLSMAPGRNGGTVIHCQAGCAPEDVLAAVGLTMADLQPARTDRPQIVATYDYTDEAGARLSQVVRFTPTPGGKKDFRQRRPDGAGGWIWTLSDVRRVLFGLPELQQKAIVYIPEGEKDVLALRALGLVATTNAGGAEKWKDEYAAQLVAAGAQSIVVLPDNDKPGRLHAEQVARSCHGAGLKVQVVTLPNLPDKGDISDWLGAGHTHDELAALVKMAPQYAPSTAAPEAAANRPTLALTSIGDLLQEPEEQANYLVDGLITTGSVNVLSAKPKVGKSTLARVLALAVARGEPFLGRDCPQSGTVWYLAFEGRRRDIRAHFRHMGATAADPIHVFVGQAPKNIVAAVHARAEQDRPALIIIDIMQRFLRAASTDDYAEMTLLFDLVIGIASTSGAAILLLTHNSKADRAGLDAILGSTAIAGSVDTAMLLTRTERYRTIQTVQRTGADMEERIILLDDHTGCVQLAGTRAEADRDAIADQLVAALEAAGAPLAHADWMARVEGRKTTKIAAIQSLISTHGNVGNGGNGNVSRKGSGTKHDPYIYSLSVPPFPPIGWERHSLSPPSQVSLNEYPQNSVPELAQGTAPPGTATFSGTASTPTGAAGQPFVFDPTTAFHQRREDV